MSAKAKKAGPKTPKTARSKTPKSKKNRPKKKVTPSSTRSEAARRGWRTRRAREAREHRARVKAARKGAQTRARRAKAMKRPGARRLKPKLADFELATKDGRASLEIKESHGEWYAAKTKIRRGEGFATYEDIITKIGLELGLTMGRIEAYVTS